MKFLFTTLLCAICYCAVSQSLSPVDVDAHLNILLPDKKSWTTNTPSRISTLLSNGRVEIWVNNLPHLKNELKAGKIPVDSMKVYAYAEGFLASRHHFEKYDVVSDHIEKTNGRWARKIELTDAHLHLFEYRFFLRDTTVYLIEYAETQPPSAEERKKIFTSIKIK